MNFDSKFWTCVKWCAVLALVAGVVWWWVSQQAEKKKIIVQKKTKIEELISRYHAVKEWNQHFDEDGYAVDGGHRPIYTVDIERELLRNDGRPILIVGYIFEVQRTENGFMIGLKYDGYPDLNFLLSAEEVHAQTILRQRTENGDLFALVANVRAVHRPQFETDCCEYDTDEEEFIEVVVEPGDQYILKGKCLALVFIGEYND